MDIFNKKRVSELEVEIERLKEENYRIYNEKSVLMNKNSDLELKVKCLKMWCDDDEAIDELMAAVKEKKAIEKPVFYNPQAALMAQSSGMGQCGQASAGPLGMGALGGMFGRGY